VVLVLHGGYGTAEGAHRQFRFDADADAHGFVAVYPEGLYRAWNGGDCCGKPKAEGVDDVGFISAVIDDLAAHYPIDRRRVYATGMSNGSVMSHRLACDLSDRIAAIAGVAGQMGREFMKRCRPGRPVPVLHIHGTGDRCAVYLGGMTAGGCTAGPGKLGLRVCRPSDPPVPDPDHPPPGIHCLGRNPAFPELQTLWDPAPETVEFWKRHDRCGAEPARSTRTGAVEHLVYACAGAPVEFYRIEGGGHSWPGGGPGACCEPNREPNRDIRANDVIWSFFEGKALPDPAMGPSRSP
jgi:polyhydroxybutyrate depolymerase